jgi:hypothetical protein
VEKHAGHTIHKNHYLLLGVKEHYLLSSVLALNRKALRGIHILTVRPKASFPACTFWLPKKYFKDNDPHPFSILQRLKHI